MTTAFEKSERQLPEPVARRGINPAQWITLKHTLYPGVSDAALFLVLDYCAARQLDPMKRPVHVVPVEVKVGDGREWREIPMISIYELRTTAQRTGLYLGHSTPQYGSLIKVGNVEAPEYCGMTFYRHHPGTGQRIEFPVRTLFREVVATDRSGKVNARWSRAPVQMLTKCCEAAGLREAFPDEISGQHIAEEREGQRLTVDEPPTTTTVDAEPPLVKPEGFDDWLLDLVAVADEGAELFASTWAAAAREHREYLNATEPERYELLKAHAATKGSQA